MEATRSDDFRKRPTAGAIVAEGTALGTLSSLRFAPKGQSNSIPQIPFVVTNVAFFQNAQIFILERFYSVMFFLIENVFPHSVEIRCAYAEKPVAILPVEIWNAQCFDEFRGIFLENLNELSRREFFRKIAKDVNVIRHATDGN